MNNPMVEAPVARVLVRFALPILVGLVFTVSFQIADTYFIGTMGLAELAAIGFVFPVILTITHIATGFDVGTMATVSPLIGKGDRKGANKLIIDTALLVLGVAFALMVVGFFTLEPIFSALGAKGTSLELVRDYMQVWYFGLPLAMLPIVFAGALRSAGNSKDPGMLLTLGAILNVILDPMFIFGFSFIPAMGIRGAAVASIISRVIYTVLLARILIRKEKLFVLADYAPAGMLASWKTNTGISIPAALNNLLSPLAGVITTRILAEHGDAAVGGLGAAQRLEALAAVCLLCVAIALAPFTGQNLGAGRIDRVREGVSFGVKYALGVGLFFFFVGVLGAGPLSRVFSDVPSVQAVIQGYLWVVGASYFGQGFLMVGAITLNTLQRPLLATGITAARVFGAYVPLAYLGSHYFGIEGVFYAITLTNIAFGVLMLVVTFHRIRQVEAVRDAGAGPSAPLAGALAVGDA